MKEGRRKGGGREGASEVEREREEGRVGGNVQTERGMFVGCLLACLLNVPAKLLVYLREESAQTIARASALR